MDYCHFNMEKCYYLFILSIFYSYFVNYPSFFLCFYVFLYFSIISTIFEYVLKPFCFFMAKLTFLHVCFCMFLLTQNMYKCHLTKKLFSRS